MVGGIIANVKLSLTLRRRKQVRIIEQQRAKKAHWAASLKPRPDLRDRRFNTWSMERRQRYLKANEGLI